MSTLQNPMVANLGRHYARQGRRDTLAEGAYTTLRNEMIDALLTDPSKVVLAPAFKPRRNTAADVLADKFDSKDGEQALVDLLRIVGLCAQGKADHELHLRASAWIAARASEYAAWHQADLLDELEGE